MYKAQQFELIFNAIERVKADLQSKQVSYDHLLFDGIDLTVSHDSNVDDIVVIYNLTRKLRSYERGN